jgi:tight adherence protein C
MIDLTNSSAQFWWLLAAVTIPVAVFSGYRLWVIEWRERVRRLRLETFRGAIRADNQPVRPPSWSAVLADLLAPIVGVVEQQRLLKLLAAAGIKRQGSLANFIAAKALIAIALIGLTWFLHVAAGVMVFRIGALGIAFLLGWRLPDLVLNHLVKRRRLRLEQGMPDALDLLVICSEAGLSLNQAIEEVSRELRLSNQDVADEFAAASAEMRVLPDIGRALDNLVERTGLSTLRSLIATLKQSLQYGTPLAESLRMIAAEMRAERQARIEERAARLPVLLAVPMMMFILPCLMMIIGTPVVLRLIDVFKNITIGSP